MNETTFQNNGRSMADLSNAMVALHRQHYGRGPAAARASLKDGMAICVLSDIYTRAERTLIAAGRLDHVQATRLLHRHSAEPTYQSAAEAALGRPVAALLSAFHSDPDLAVDVFVLGEGNGKAGAGP